MKGLPAPLVEEKDKIGLYQPQLIPGLPYVIIPIHRMGRIHSLYIASESIKAKSHENRTPLLITQVNEFEYNFPDVDFLHSFKFWVMNIIRFVVLSLSFF